ncbi:MAG TPA: Ku protein [Beutenbergiaceae bacterium]|nr:Ku protein [Beutenbergiaceae bacterium]
MARSIWTGAVSFGLVSIPVKLYPATEEKTVRFRQFEQGTSSRIKYKRVNEETGKEVDYTDIVKGYELGGGEYVLLQPEELDEIAPGRSQIIDITDFVDADEIDPIFYRKTYFLSPSDKAGLRAYSLLTAAMAQADRIAIGNFVMRSKQYLAALRPRAGVLALETMYFADEVREPVIDTDEQPAEVEPRARDMKMARDLIESMTTSWEPENYVDTYREKVLDLVQAKARGEGSVAPAPEEEEGEVVDLMEALRRSVEASRQHRPGNRSQTGATSTSERPAGQDLSGMSKQELYDLAKEQDIEGRSQMGKKELIAALRGAEQSAAKAS